MAIGVFGETSKDWSSIFTKRGLSEKRFSKVPVESGVLVLVLWRSNPALLTTSVIAILAKSRIAIGMSAPIKLLRVLYDTSYLLENITLRHFPFFEYLV